ncbi:MULTISPECIES: response regulator [Sphingomonas]|uniref:histidine kinase n=1 Tax=Sphingomonas leidyi TaxID=68569 RepID=A0A7X5UWW1_9SPHN|nr:MULTISPECIES: response regulator [Sphingomonas]MBN8812121.1 response regulator [Sphingomonas sp.]NIJ63226.1 PAS domain S-box-containing protein [Sphingomonas leidyi]OJY48242.1 MAG: regulator [Sphingomonas sp. 67-41]
MPQPETVKILVVDDVEKNLIAMDALLRRDGVEILKAPSGPAALELLLRHEVALALLDVQMPGMDGYELAELMRGTERTRRVPIIFVTAVATDERRRFRGYEAGAVDYLFKPVDPQIVRNKVDIFVELARQRLEIARQRDQLAAALGRIQAHSDNSPLAIVEFDAELRVIGWSNGAERLFGWSAAEVLGRRAAKLDWLDPANGAAVEAVLGQMVEGHELRRVETLRANDKGGTLLDCECYCSALFEGDRLVSVSVQILDVTERKRAEATQRLLIGELNHRVKNTLASVQAIATQTLRHSAGPSDFAPTFIGRIHALARAHSLLSATTWQGARLRELIEGQLQLGTIDPQRLSFAGPEIELSPEPALHLALVLHELGTNANKYGALSNEAGRVRLEWRLRGAMLELEWAETGGPAVTAPGRRGFGTALIERSLKAEGGSAVAVFAAEGLRWTLTVPHSGGAAELPADRPADDGGWTRGAGAAMASIAGKRFAIIEDEPLVALELAAILADAGVEVVGPAATAEHARAIVEGGRIDGALLDGNLQGASVEAIAAALDAHGVPFAFVSGYGRDHLPEGFAEVPAIGKPFDPVEIVEVAGALLRGKAVLA